MVATLQKWGNSNGIRIPKALLDELQWKDGDSLEISTENGNLLVKSIRPRKRKTIEELFAHYDGNYKPQEVDWGQPVGEEVW